MPWNLNPKPYNPKTLNRKTLNPKPSNPQVAACMSILTLACKICRQKVFRASRKGFR